MKKCKCYISALIVVTLFLSFSGVAYSQTQGGPLAPYPSPDEMISEIMALEKAHPNLVRVVPYGNSVKGWPLLAMRIGRSDGVKRPEALITGNIHGNEYIGNRLAMSVARRLAGGDGVDPWITSLLDKVDFWVIPCINPDGYVRTWAEGGNADWPVMRKNAHGVDLNRNFPMYGKTWLPIAWAGSKKPDSVYYQGAGAYNEPESRAIRDFAKQHHFFAAIDFHSWGGWVIPAKCVDHECVVNYKKMASAYNSKQAHVKYRRMQFRTLDQYTGELEDMLYHEYGALAVCIELSTSRNNKPQYKITPIKFWKNNPLNIDYWIENDRDAALAAIEKALQITGGHPAVPKH